MVKTKSTSLLKLLDVPPTTMPPTQLPLTREVLLHYFHSKPKPNASFNETKGGVISLLVDLFGKVPQPIVCTATIEKKLKRLLKDYEEAKKGAETSKKAVAFKKELPKLFDISLCRCVMINTFFKGEMLCACPLENRINEKEYDFVYDQNDRRHHFSASVDTKSSQQYEQRVVRRQLREECSPQPAVVAPIDFPQLTKTRGRKIYFHGHEDEIDDMMDRNFDGPSTPKKKLRMMDAIHAQTADRNIVSNRATSGFISHDAHTIKSCTSDVIASSASHMTVYRERYHVREMLVTKLVEEVARLEGPLQYSFDGKKVFGKERLVVCLNWADEDGSR